jgi:hypothetical protein
MLVIAGSASTQATSPSFSAFSSAADQAVALLRLAVDEVDEYVVHGAVIAAVEDHDVAAPGRGARPAQREAVGVARGHRELPVG